MNETSNPSEKNPAGVGNSGTPHRRPIPKNLKYQILYRNGNRCCVCRLQIGHQIHHVDGDPGNNSESNLAVLCTSCHSEAHTRHELAQNLTPGRIQDAKSRWEADVATGRAAAMVPKAFAEAMWSYVNLERLPFIMRAFRVNYRPSEIADLLEEGVVDKLGIPQPMIPAAKLPDALVTVYDRIPYHIRARLMDLYNAAIEDLLYAASPIDLREVDSSAKIRLLVREGELFYVRRGFRFKSEPVQPDKTQVRNVYGAFWGLTMRFTISTSFMYGTSALEGNFTGYRRTTALLIAKSFERENGETTLHCTPLALGTGFVNGTWSPGVQAAM